jgi:hypothetical protein
MLLFFEEGSGIPEFGRKKSIKGAHVVYTYSATTVTIFEDIVIRP